MEATGGIETGGRLSPPKIERLEPRATESATEKANQLKAKLGIVAALPSDVLEGRGSSAPKRAEVINSVALRHFGG